MNNVYIILKDFFNKNDYFSKFTILDNEENTKFNNKKSLIISPDFIYNRKLSDEMIMTLKVGDKFDIEDFILNFNLTNNFGTIENDNYLISYLHLNNISFVEKNSNIYKYDVRYQICISKKGE